MPMLSLAEAAKHCGVNRSTILRAVKSGKVSGTRNDDGSWSVEASELFRVFEPKADTSAAPQGAQQDTATDALVAELRACGAIAMHGASRPSASPSSRRHRPRQAAMHRRRRSRPAQPCPLSDRSLPSRHDFAALGAGAGRRGVLRVSACCSS